MGCIAIRSQLTALADGELPRWRSWQVQRHVRSCDGCRHEADSIKSAVRVQAAWLSSAPTLPAGDLDHIRRQLRVAIAAGAQDEEHRSSTGAAARRFGLQPLAATAAVGLLALSLVSWAYGGPMNLLATIGWIQPPSAVATKTELFRDYPLIQNLDALENFDNVNDIPLEEETSSNGPTWVG